MIEEEGTLLLRRSQAGCSVVSQAERKVEYKRPVIAPTKPAQWQIPSSGKLLKAISIAWSSSPSSRSVSLLSAASGSEATLADGTLDDG